MNFLAYIQGKRRGKDAHNIERKAMEDPFLADALDGFDTVDGEHAERIAAIRTRLSVRGRKSNRRIMYVSVAASLFLCICVGGYYLMNMNEQPLIAQHVLSENKEDIIERVISEEEQVEDIQTVSEPLEQEEQKIRSHVESGRGIVFSDTSSSSQPIVRKEVLPAQIMTNEEAEIQLSSEVAAMEMRDYAEDSVVIAQMEIGQISNKLNRSSDTESQMMASVSSGKPEPEIGIEAYKKYLKDSMTRPRSGVCAEKKGDVIVEFKINGEGRPYHIEFKQKLCEDLDKEAVRLIQYGPVWRGDTHQSIILEVTF